MYIYIYILYMYVYKREIVSSKCVVLFSPRQLVDIAGCGGGKGSCASLAAAFLKAACGCGHIWYYKVLGHGHSLFGCFLVPASIIFVRTVPWKR